MGKRIQKRRFNSKKKENTNSNTYSNGDNEQSGGFFPIVLIAFYAFNSLASQIKGGSLRAQVDKHFSSNDFDKWLIGFKRDNSEGFLHLTRRRLSYTTVNYRLVLRY